jgi:hypothetical protein
MKNDRQYRDSAMFTLIGYIGIILVILVTLIGVGEYTGFNQEIREGLRDDPRPANHMSNYLPPSFYLELDTLKNNLDILDQRLDSLMKVEKVVDSILLLQYNDEYKMWIGGDGDTIWE